MKPNRPRVVTSSRNYITLAWDSCDSLPLKSTEGEEEGEQVGENDADENAHRWYVLQTKDRVLGWRDVYKGFKTHAVAGPLAPEDYYEFRVKSRTRKKESDWSDIMFAITKDDVVSVGQLHRTVENGPVTTLRKILNQRHSSVDVPNKFGQSSLRLAILKNNTNFMGILLNHGADIEGLEPGSGRTPLMTAAAKGFLEAVQLLVERGSSWHTKDRNGLTAFNYAVDNSHLPVVRWAVEEGVNISTKDKSGWSPFMRGVVLKSSVDVLSYLLDSGSNPNESNDRQQTVLMQAVLSGRPQVVQLLLDRGADVSARNAYDHSAYDMAKCSFSEGIVKMAHLLEKDTDESSERVKPRERKRCQN